MAQALSRYLHPETARLTKPLPPNSPRVPEDPDDLFRQCF